GATGDSAGVRNCGIRRDGEAEPARRQQQDRGPRRHARPARGLCGLAAGRRRRRELTTSHWPSGSRLFRRWESQGDSARGATKFFAFAPPTVGKPESPSYVRAASPGIGTRRPGRRTMSFAGPAVVALFFALLGIVVVALSVRTVPQGYTFVVERLGRYSRTLAPGFNLLIPFVDSVRARVSMRETVLDIPEQSVIT